MRADQEQIQQTNEASPAPEIEVYGYMLPGIELIRGSTKT